MQKDDVVKTNPQVTQPYKINLDEAVHKIPVWVWTFVLGFLLGALLI
jgi:hypothetical protein